MRLERESSGVAKAGLATGSTGNHDEPDDPTDDFTDDDDMI